MQEVMRAQARVSEQPIDGHIGPELNIKPSQAVAELACMILAVELIEWSVGGARLVSVPGEAFHAFGRAVEDARPGPVLLAGLAPVWFGYLPVPFREGYEESMSYGEPFVGALLAALTST